MKRFNDGFYTREFQEAVVRFMAVRQWTSREVAQLLQITESRINRWKMRQEERDEWSRVRNWLLEHVMFYIAPRWESCSRYNPMYSERAFDTARHDKDKVQCW